MWSGTTVDRSLGVGATKEIHLYPIRDVAQSREREDKVPNVLPSSWSAIYHQCLLLAKPIQMPECKRT